MLEDIIRKWNGAEVSPMAVYTDMFNLGEGEIQKNGEEKGQFKANPIGYWKNGQSKGHYRIFFDDTFEETLRELQEADFAIINGLTYFGRKNLQEHASKLYAMIFDLDGITDKTLNAFLSGAFDGDAYPVPNYIALSGHGVHLYYLFEQGIPLYPNIKLQLKAFKYAMIEKIWNRYTSIEKKKQFQGINQGFRPIGGKTKIEGVRVRAFRINQHPFSLEQLGQYIPKESRVDESKLWKETKMSLAEARRRYPEWYQSKVVEKQPRRYWECNEALYNWWIEQIKQGASYGHRYFAIMCLAIYGVKCGLSVDQVKVDAFSLIPFLNSLNPAEPFTEADVLSALECYDEKYCTFPVKDIEKISGIPIQKSKRNGRTQAAHLKRARAVQAIDYPDGEWRGRKPKADIVRQWRREHPDGTPTQAARDLQISRTTAYKYWSIIPTGEKPPAEPAHRLFGGM